MGVAAAPFVVLALGFTPAPRIKPLRRYRAKLLDPERCFEAHRPGFVLWQVSNFVGTIKAERNTDWQSAELEVECAGRL